MVTTGFTANIGLSSLIRILTTGFLNALIYSYSIIPLCDTHLGLKPFNQLPLSDKFIVWIILGVFIGLFLISIDIYIYQFFEGLCFWPGCIKNLKFIIEERKFKDMDRRLNVRIGEEQWEREKNNKEDKDKLENINREILKLSEKLRDYPYDLNQKFFCNRHSERPTKFGNLLAEYESYPEKQYNIHMRVFWPHIWLILPKDIRGDMELRGAMADFPVYLSFSFLCFSIIGPIGLFFQKGAIIASLVLIMSMALSGMFYKISIMAHRNYGKYVKAIFDLYRCDLGNKLGIKTHTIPTDDEMDNWLKYRSFASDYSIYEFTESDKKNG